MIARCLRRHHKQAVLTEVAAADAVDERVAAAGREDERLGDGVEHGECQGVRLRRLDAVLRVGPLLVEAHEPYDVIRRPADNKRRSHGKHHRRHSANLSPSAVGGVSCAGADSHRRRRG